MTTRLWTPGGPQDFTHIEDGHPPNRKEKRQMMNDIRAYRRRAARERDRQAKAAGTPTPPGKIAEWIRATKAYIWLD